MDLQFLTKSLNVVEKGCEYLGMGFLCLMGVLAVLQILMRFGTAQTIGFSVTWTGELTRYLLVLMTTVGVPYAMRTDAHISLRPLVEMLPDAISQPVLAVTNLLVVSLCLMVAYSAYVVSQSTLSQSLATLDWVKIGYAHVLIGLMFLLAAVIALEKTYEIVWNDPRGGSET